MIDARPERPTRREIPGTVPCEHVWTDALGWPLNGTVILTPQARLDLDGHAVLPAPVPVDVVDGRMNEMLPPGTYAMTAQLRTRDGALVTDSGVLTLDPA